MYFRRNGVDIMKKHLSKRYVGRTVWMLFCAVIAGSSVFVQASDGDSGGYNITLYQGNEQADGFVTSQVTIKYKTAYSILNKLKEMDVIASDVKANSLEYKGEELVLDLSEEFLTDILASGSAGEYIKVGSVVNTFIDAFDTEALTITVDGESWESGHVLYDAPLSKYAANDEKVVENRDKEITINMYIGNANADGFDVIPADIKYKTAYSIIRELKAVGAVAADVKAHSLEYEGEELILDLSEEFAKDISGTGTTGEYIKVGSVVNTFAEAFGVEALTITVDGESWKSGHCIYDGPIQKYD